MGRRRRENAGNSKRPKDDCHWYILQLHPLRRFPGMLAL